MSTRNDTPDSTTDHRQDDCRCPDDRCAGYHHEVGEYCYCTPRIERTSDFAESEIVHPPKCYGGCNPEDASMVEHVTETHVLSTDTVTATGSLRIITACRDYRKDDLRRDIPEIKVTAPNRGVTSTISGTPDDLRALGEFIIAQASRFHTALGPNARVSA